MPSLKMTIGLPSRRAFGSFCIFGALASISGLAYMRWRLEDQVRHTEYYQMAIQQLRRHSGAVDLLGEPIRESGFKLSNEKNRCDAEKAQLQVAVHGPKDRGTVYFWATNNQQMGGWLIDRLELETKQHPNKRFLLKKPSTSAQQISSEGDMDSDLYAEQSHEVVAVQEPQGPAKQIEEPVQVSLPPASNQNHPVQQMRQREDEEPIPFVQTSEGGHME